MAGTRLAIQATFLLEFVLLICVAAYFGLCHFNNDILCTPLFGQAGRSLLVLPPNWNEQNLFYLETKESKSLRRCKLHVALVLEDGSEWSEWAHEMDSILSENNLIQHPCLVGPIQTEISLNGNLSDEARKIPTDHNKTEYRVSGTTVETWLLSRRDPHDESRLDVLLYVPMKSRMPLYIKLNQQEPVSVLSWERALLILVEHAEDDNKTAAVGSALDYVEPFLQDKCHLSSDSAEWWTQLVHDTYERAKELVMVNHNVMSNLSLKVRITNDVTRRWKTSVDLVEEGEVHAKERNYMAAVECFEESFVTSQSLLKDPTLMDPIDMQTDHYMAVFFPLIFPLLLPFVAGFIREVKRYRKLKRGEGEEGVVGSDSKTKVD